MNIDRLVPGVGVFPACAYRPSFVGAAEMTDDLFGMNEDLRPTPGRPSGFLVAIGRTCSRARPPREG